MVYAVTDSRTSPSRAARTRRSCPSCTFQDLVGRGHGLGGQRVKIHIIIIRVKIPRRIAVQLGQAGGVGQRDRRAQGQRLQRRDAKALEHGGVQKQLAVLHQRGVLGIGHIARVEHIVGVLRLGVVAKGTQVLAARDDKRLVGAAAGDLSDPLEVFMLCQTAEGVEVLPFLMPGILSKMLSSGVTFFMCSQPL